MNRLELSNIQPLVNKPDLKINTTGRRQIDPNLIHVEPNKESLDLDPLKIRNRPVFEDPGDPVGIVDEVVELDVAGGAEIDGEGAVVGDGVGGDGVR